MTCQVRKVSINIGHVWILGAFSWKSHKILWKWDSKHQFFRDFLQFWKVVKSIHKHNGILLIWKYDFTISTISSQKLTIYALKRNTLLIFRRSVIFYYQNHQFRNGKSDTSGVSEFHSRGAQLLLVPTPNLVFWARFAKTPRSHPIG